jgi:hypothetical protein
MSSVVISGDTSGAITVSAPAVSGTNTLTLQAGTATNSMNTLGTAVASTSGTSIDFTSLPSWIKRITVMFSGVSTSGTSNLLIRFGSGSVDTSGYASVNGSILGTNTTNIATNTSGHLITPSVTAATNQSGTAILSLIGSNTWIVNGTSQRNDGVVNTVITTKTALSGALDQVRITTVNGTDTFDAGTVNILYEG